MKNKNYLYYSLVIVLIFLGGFVWSVNIALAALEFEPNVPIPGLNITSVDGSTLATYIVGLYRYGAGFAGAAAMFMLVFAGWQWLFAAGDASRIGKAKDTINGVLVGLLLLFGGYLLLAQISDRLVSFDTLELTRIKPIKSDYEYCLSYNQANNPANNITCGEPILATTSPSGVGFGIKCLDTLCGSDLSNASCVLANGIGDCPTAVGATENLPDCICVQEIICSSYNDFNCGYYGSNFEACRRNTCFGQFDQSGRIDDKCRVREVNGQVQCIYMPGTGCNKNEECFLDENGDGASEWCCADISNQEDRCEQVGAPGVTCGAD